MSTEVADQYLHIDSMPEAYPMFCQTQCCAWNQLYNKCNGHVMGRKECRWSVSKITARILSKQKIAGDKWWKAPRGNGDGCTAEGSDTAVD